MDEHAQREIRSYATIIGEEIVARWLPIVWTKYSLLSRRKDGSLAPNRERAELEAELRTIDTGRDFGRL